MVCIIKIFAHPASPNSDTGYNSFPPSRLVSDANNPPSGAREHHAIVDQAQDFDDTVRCHTVDNEMAWRGNAACRFDPTATQPGRISADAAQMRHVDRTDHLRRLTECGHDRQNELTVSACRLQAVILGALEEDGVDLLFRRPGEPIGQLSAGGKASQQPCRKAILQMLFVFRGRHCGVSASFDVGGAGFDR